jgi:hypothetical protein
MKGGVSVAIDCIVNANCVYHFQERVAHSGHVQQELNPAITWQIVQARHNGIGQEQ